MLQNLNACSIAPYGRLLSAEKSQFDVEICVTGGQPACCYRADAPCWLAPEENMAVLQLQSAQGAVSFYLDKLVELNAGVEFAILTVDDSCKVACRCDAPLTPLPERTPQPLPVLQSSLRVQQVCTLHLQVHGPGFFFAGEQHHAYELVFLTHGTLHTLIGGRDFLLHENEGLLIPPDDWHVQYGDEHAGVSFLIASFFTAAPLPHAVLLRSFPEKPQITAYIQALLQELEEEKSYRSDMVLTLLQGILVRYARLADCQMPDAAQTPAALRNENQILDRAVHYIADHTRSHLTVEALARACSVSASYLTILFRRHLQTSPAAYMLRVRLEESRQLIRSGSAGMNEIAALLRFSSAPHFSAAFKRQYGLSPTAYAKSLRE